MNHYNEKNKYTIVLLLIILLIPSTLQAATEKEWQQAWNKAFAHGTTEIPIEYGRIDILTDEYAIEVDHVSKFHEGIGQALHYADATGKKPGLALFMDDKGDTTSKYLYAKKLCKKLGIKVWLMNAEVNPNTGKGIVEEPTISEQHTEVTKPQEEKILEPCTLISVINSETIKVKWRDEEVEVQLRRLDSPDRDSDNYQKASEALRYFLEGKDIYLEYELPGIAVKDLYGRLLAYVIVDNKNINIEMVRSGWSFFWAKPGKCKYEEEFRKAQEEAKENKRGLWGD